MDKSDNQVIRIGIVGAGGNTQGRHIPGLKNVGGIELVRVCNRSTESSRKAADQFGFASYTTNWREITDADDIDAVVIGTWPYLHSPISIAALEGGKHVMCEARMAMNGAEAREMLRASRNRPDLTAMVVPSPFTLHVDATLRRLIAAGYLGEIVSVDVRGLASDFPNPETPLHWREDRNLSGNNILALGIWYEAIMRWLGEARKVTAVGQTVMQSRLSDGVERSISIPDHIDVVAEMYCGAQLHIQLSSVALHPGGPDLWIYGTEGVLRMHEGAITGIKRGESALAEIQTEPGESSGWRVEEEFIGAIRGDEAVKLTTFVDGVRYMEFTDAVTSSLARGVSIPIHSL